MSTIAEKGGGSVQGLKLLLCENPLPPLDEAVAAARDELERSNFYTEPYSAPLRALLAERLGVAERLVHSDAGSELILRQIFDRFGRPVRLLTPTYPLFPEVAQRWTQTPLQPDRNLEFDLSTLAVPDGTTLVVIANPNNPNGGIFDRCPLPDLLVTRTLSKTHSLAGYRVGYGIFPQDVADDLNARNDAYPLARASQATAIATLRHEAKIDPELGAGFMRIATAHPDDNRRFLDVVREILAADGP